MLRFSRWNNILGAALVGLSSACNLVIGNEEGLLEETDASLPDPPVDPDAQTPAPDSDASVTEPETSVGDPDAPVVEGAVEEGVVVADAVVAERDAPPGDGASKDAARPIDGADDRRMSEAGTTCDTGASVCAEGQVATGMQMCGPCGRGVQTRKRTCAPGGCAWGEWSPWSTCSVTTAECMPGQTSDESQACGPCNTGTQSRRRSCTSACTWGAWEDFGTCGNITAECLPDHWRCCGAGKWEWCYLNSCKWTGGCAPCNGSCNCS